MSVQFHVSVVALLVRSVHHRVGPDVATSRLAAVHPVLQSEWSYHVVAMAAIVILAVLGGMLVVRKRLRREKSFSTDSTTDSQEFRTDREKVCELIGENGGRMKQSEIVDSVDWSKAKVSRLLTELEDDDRITKLRLGRENLVCLPGHEPTASQSTDTNV